MTLRHLKIFTAVCQNGGITRAAEALHITQPAVSHTISELEKYYNITLFERINQRLVLTDVGKEVLAKAQEAVKSFDDFEEFASLGGNNPRVAIGCSLTFGQTVIPEFMKKISSLYPEIEPKIAIRASSILENELEAGRLDFALTEGKILSPYLNMESFRHERLMTVANAEFEIEGELEAAELAHYPMILRERGSVSRDYFDRHTSSFGVHIDPIIESANNQAIVAALYASIGVAFLPESLVEGHIERGKLKEIKVHGLNGEQTSYLIIHKNKKLGTVGRTAYELLKSLK